MFHQTKNFIFFLTGCWLLILPLFVLAQAPSVGTASVELPNPVGTTDISILVGNIIRAILGLLGVLALIMFIWGGLLWMTSAGNEKKVTQGRDTLVWAVAGLALVFFSYALLNFVLNVILQVQS